MTSTPDLPAPLSSSLKNWGGPLVTAQIMTHSGDREFLPRAFASVLAQDLPKELLRIQVVHDGPLDPESAEDRAFLTTLNTFADDSGCDATFFATERKYGYYCVPRAGALAAITTPYIAFLDGDNEWAPGHLSGLLTEIRTSRGAEGWPHFVYSRREYIRDHEDLPARCPSGPSPLVEWTKEARKSLLSGPTHNFIDTGDMLWSTAALFRLSAVTGCSWNHECRRFGDWDLVCRAIAAKFRGRAVDQITNLYHWTGKNVQLTRAATGQDHGGQVVDDGVVALPVAMYEELIKRGWIKRSHTK